MFRGEKTLVFWTGLIIFGLVSWGLFGIVWSIVNYHGNRLIMLKYDVPFIVGGVIFLLIGLYMMKSGLKEKPKS